MSYMSSTLPIMDGGNRVERHRASAGECGIWQRDDIKESWVLHPASEI
jgi:hypothetical protein